MSTIDIGDFPFPAIINVKRGNELRRYVPERTYHPDRVSTAYHSAIECSECKHLLDEVTIYCPNCGARLEGVGR